MILVRSSFQILDDLNPERIYRIIEQAGRICYKSTSSPSLEQVEEFIRKRLKQGHESIIEHEKISVKIVCDRGVSHEGVRHRLINLDDDLIKVEQMEWNPGISQESTRYCDYDKGHITFVIPPWVRADARVYESSTGTYGCEADITWITAMLHAEMYYKSLREAGWKPEEARSVLPNSLKTEFICTANLREWRYFFRLRTASAAHPQMREIAIPLLSEFKHRLPVIFEDINPPHSEHYYLSASERN